MRGRHIHTFVDTLILPLTTGGIMKDFLLRSWKSANKGDRSDLEEAALAILGASIKKYKADDRELVVALYSEDIEAYARRL
jgi:hypothetical protein